MAFGARRSGYRHLIVAVENAAEAALVEGLEVSAAPSLTRIVDLMAGRWSPGPPPARPPASEHVEPIPDLADVRGQNDAKRALEIAAAGGHNLLMVGPPGVGKTMLARRLPAILPPLTREEAIEVTQVRSAGGLGDGSLAAQRPFRAPHHTISPSGLVGGGAIPRPGEITLAHRGVLFLDELPEFSRAALEALRQPLETRSVRVTRGQVSVTFPAAAQLVGACNACPCARPARDCTCDEADRARYARRLSAPLLDRIDLVCQLELPQATTLLDQRLGETCESPLVRDRVRGARERQQARLAGSGAHCNAAMGTVLTRRHVRLSAPARDLLRAGMERASLSARGHDRALRIARTIADLSGGGNVSNANLEEALAYRLTGVGAGAT